MIRDIGTRAGFSPAGYDTTFAALGSVWYETTTDRSAMRRLANELIANIPGRVNYLATYLAGQGVDLVPGVAGCRVIDSWLRTLPPMELTHSEVDVIVGGFLEEQRWALHQVWRLSDQWMAFALDLAVFLGEQLRELSAQLTWVVPGGRSPQGFQPALRGIRVEDGHGSTDHIEIVCNTRQAVDEDRDRVREDGRDQVTIAYEMMTRWLRLYFPSDVETLRLAKRLPRATAAHKKRYRALMRGQSLSLELAVIAASSPQHAEAVYCGDQDTADDTPTRLVDFVDALYETWPPIDGEDGIEDAYLEPNLYNEFDGEVLAFELHGPDALLTAMERDIIALAKRHGCMVLASTGILA